MNDEGELRMAFSPDWIDDGFARVYVRARASGFAGAGRCWTYPQSLTEFAACLRAYPLDASSPPTFVGGHCGRLDGSVAPLETFRVEAVPDGPFGQIALVIALASDDERPTAGRRDLATFVLRTTYERLRRFADEVDAIAAGREPEAVIAAERLA